MENRILSNEYRRVLELGDMTNTPKVMSLDITNKCNFRCKHCFNSSGDDSVYCFKDELTDEEVIKFSKELCEFGLSQICICGGEPTLRIDLVYKVIEMLKKRDIDVNMVSNGYLITRDISQKLKKSGINSVQISVDGLGEIHDKFRNMPGAYKHAIAAINYLYENQIEVMVSCCPNQYNYLGLEMYFEYIYSLGVTKIRMMPFLPLGRGKESGKEILLNDRQIYIVCQQINKWNLNNPEQQVEWGDPINHLYSMLFHNNRKPEMICVGSNGDVKLTPYLDSVVGNIRKEGIEYIWSNKVKKKMKNPEFISQLKQIKGIYCF